MSRPRVLSGVQPTGALHLGNWLGAIRNWVDLQETHDTFVCVVDLHAITVPHDPSRLAENTRSTAALYLACGMDPKRCAVFVQSQVAAHSELCWLLNCVTPLNWLERMIQFKEKAVKQGDNVSLGLLDYPVLMAADILMFNANKVPVGRDQIQHIEMARDMAGRFNHLFKGQYFVQPEAVVDEKVEVLKGLDGRKMSKSYNNTIPLFVSEKKLQKLVRKIKTNSLEPGEPKDPDTCTLFQIFSAFASESEALAMRQQYAEGIGWGEAKDRVFEYVNAHLSAPRERYNALMEDPAHIEAVLQKGAERAREEAAVTMDRLRAAVGLGRFV